VPAKNVLASTDVLGTGPRSPRPGARSDVTGHGRVVVLMDINWLESSYGDTTSASHSPSIWPRSDWKCSACSGRHSPGESPKWATSTRCRQLLPPKADALGTASCEGQEPQMEPGRTSSRLSPALTVK